MNILKNFRPLRRTKQAATAEECTAILTSAWRGMLAVHGEDGYPYAIPLNFIFQDGKLYFHCAMDGHKLDAVRADSRVCFTVLSEPVKNPGEWWNCFISVVCFGRIAEVRMKAGRIPSSVPLAGNISWKVMTSRLTWRGAPTALWCWN